MLVTGILIPNRNRNLRRRIFVVFKICSGNPAHQLARFVMIIVGTAETPRGLYVGTGNRKELIELTPQ